MMSTI